MVVVAANSTAAAASSTVAAARASTAAAIAPTSSPAPHIHRHRHFRRGFAVGVPLAAYGAYYYTGTCDWLRRKAYITGSGYWLDRYYACLDGYY